MSLADTFNKLKLDKTIDTCTLEYINDDKEECIKHGKHKLSMWGDRYIINKCAIMDTHELAYSAFHDLISVNNAVSTQSPKDD